MEFSANELNLEGSYYLPAVDLNLAKAPNGSFFSKDLK